MAEPVLYVVVDVGCWECGELTYLLGVFTNRDDAERVRNDNAAQRGDDRDGYSAVWAVPALNQVMYENALEW